MKKYALPLVTCLSLLIGSMNAAGAQTLNFGDAVRLWAQSCGTDVENYCKGIRPGGNRLGQCLMANASPQCQQATRDFQSNMDARFAAQAQAPRLCAASVKRLCSNFKGGQARILRCMMRPVNFRKANVSCKNALINAGWLDEVSIRSN